MRGSEGNTVSEASRHTGYPVHEVNGALFRLCKEKVFPQVGNTVYFIQSNNNKKTKTIYIRKNCTKV
jgi:hypothetical protein